MLTFLKAQKNIALTDISVQHTYRQRNNAISGVFTLHPFKVERGSDAGKYEILRDIEETGKKRSTHVTTNELAELFARNLLGKHGIRLRLRPESNDYPTSPPAKKVSQRAIEAGSDFEKLVMGISPRSPVSPGLKNALSVFSVYL